MKNDKKLMIYISDEIKNKIKALKEKGYNTQVILRKAITEKINKLMGRS